MADRFGYIYIGEEESVEGRQDIGGGRSAGESAHAVHLVQKLRI